MGSLTLAELLEQADRDEIVGKMKVLSVLEALPGIGKVKARRLMEEVGISETPAAAGARRQPAHASCFDKLSERVTDRIDLRHLRAGWRRQGHLVRRGSSPTIPARG